MSTKPAAPTTGACPTCGHEHTMTLAQDVTQYSTLVFGVDGRWFKVDPVRRTEPSEEDDSNRMFCTNCGEYFQLPEELCQ